MNTLKIVKKYTDKITGGDSAGERFYRALAHFFVLFVDRKIGWHCRGILRELNIKRL